MRDKIFSLVDAKSLLKKELLPQAILVCGGISRIVSYTTSAIRYDESISLFRAQTPFIQYLIDFQKYSSLILWELILRLFTMFGSNLWIIRLPSLIIGVITLWLLWKISKCINLSQPSRIIIFSICSFTPGLLWISQDARAYGLLVCLYLLLIFFVIKEKWAGYFAVCGLLMYTHVIGPAFAVGGFCFAIANYPKSWKKVLSISGLALIVWIPWFILFLRIQQVNGFTYEFWLEKINIQGVLRNIELAFFVRNVENFVSTIFFLTLGITTPFLLFKSFKHPQKEMLFFNIPFLVILLESIFWKNTLFYRTMITLIIPYSIWLGSVLSKINGRILRRLIYVSWLLLTVIGFVGWDPASRGGKLDKTAQYINNEWEKGDILYYATATVALPFDYYLPEKPNYIINGLANANLTPPTLHGFLFEALEDIPYTRAWVIFPMDTFIPPNQMKRIEDYVKNGELIDRIQVFEVPDILVYLVKP